MGFVRQDTVRHQSGTYQAMLFEFLQMASHGAWLSPVAPPVLIQGFAVDLCLRYVRGNFERCAREPIELGAMRMSKGLN